MEYIKKEELIEGEVYKANNESLTFIMKATKDLNNVINIPSYNEFMKSGNFNGSYLTFINATSEEKHWLNTCIQADKFISYEEAMKTFIPEYIEAIRQSDGYTIGKIYKTLSDSTKTWYKNIDDKNRENGWYYSNFKPSTKEAYDAQFIVKEPEFVLPEKWYTKITSENKDIINHWRRNIIQYKNSDCQYETISQNGSGSSLNFMNEYKFYQEITFEQFKKYVLKEETAIEFGNKVDKEIIEQPVIENKTELEIWLENTKSLNLELYKLINYIGNSSTCSYYNIYTKLEGRNPNHKAKILFDKWNEKVIEPLPQFKVIETIETITKVENNEGNQFFIGDVVKTIADNIYTIKSFEYNIDKSNILAMTDKNTLISIDNIEHYIEPKVEIEDKFVLPEKWCIKRNNENDKIVTDYINKIASMRHSYLSNNIYNPYLHNNTAGCCSSYGVRANYTEITFDQFKKYVLKETISEEPGMIFIPEETLLDKAKRLYPIGTKFKVACNPNYIGTVKDHNDYPFQDVDIVNLNTKENIDGCTGMTVYYKGKWAEIIK